MFDEMDIDDSNALDLSEFQCKCSDFGLSDDAIQQLFVILDANQDGEVTVDEFVDGWSKFLEAQGCSTDGDDSGSEAEHVPLNKLDQSIQEAFASGRAVLLCDPPGNASTFLQQAGALVMNCREIFVLGKIRGTPPEQIGEQARSKLVEAMKSGRWLHMDMLNTTPAIGEICSDECFPADAVLSPKFGQSTELHEKIVKDEERDSDVWAPRGDWVEKGHGVIVTTQLSSEDYREFLSSAWPEFPFSSMKEIIVKAQ